MNDVNEEDKTNRERKTRPNRKMKKEGKRRRGDLTSAKPEWFPQVEFGT